MVDFESANLGSNPGGSIMTGELIDAYPTKGAAHKEAVKRKQSLKNVETMIKVRKTNFNDRNKRFGVYVE